MVSFKQQPLPATPSNRYSWASESCSDSRNMGRKKKRAENQRIYCWYCERDFASEHELVHHQKEKHLKCPTCYKRMVSTSGLVVHAMQVHKRAVTVPNAIEGREDPRVDVFGMQGIPAGRTHQPLDAVGKPKRQKTLAGSGVVGGNGSVGIASNDSGSISGQSALGAGLGAASVPGVLPPAYGPPVYPPYASLPPEHAAACAQGGYVPAPPGSVPMYGGMYQQYGYGGPYPGHPLPVQNGGHRQYPTHPGPGTAWIPPRQPVVRQQPNRPAPIQKPTPVHSTPGVAPSGPDANLAAGGVGGREEVIHEGTSEKVQLRSNGTGCDSAKKSGLESVPGTLSSATQSKQAPKAQKADFAVVFGREDVSMEELRARLPRYRVSLLNRKKAENKS